MANILTASEAAAVLRVDVTDPAMLGLLDGVDEYIQHATGRDWSEDETIRPVAKAAARMLLVNWYENPAMSGSGQTTLNFGLKACLVQLEALALQLETLGVPDEALSLEASFPVDGQNSVSTETGLTLVFNHEMAAGAVNQVSLEDSAGESVTCAASLDVTQKIMSLTPSSSLTAGADYSLVIAAADVYGATLSETIRFSTAE